MPIIHLQPSDLSAAQVEQVLDFLNRASSAAQLDRDIEFPGEPDIGLRLGQRLLDARAALGGRFTDIMQVRAIRLIGPERFTEICVAALGLDTRRWVELFFGADPLSVPTESGLTLSLWAPQHPAWLGQPVSLSLQVRDHGGTPRPGVPVTVQTSIGRLVYLFGFTRIEGQAITVMTGADGSATLDLLTPPGEPLSESQQAALEDALARLDPEAGSPLALEAGLRAMATDYLRDRSYSLRRAIDLYVREHREPMLDSLNPGHWRLSWPVDSGLIQADVLSPADNGASVARGVRTVSWVNWVGAWLSFFADVLEDGSGLQQTFAETAAGATTAGNSGQALGQLLHVAQHHLAAHSGRSAEWVGKRQIDSAVSSYLAGDLSALDPAARDALVSQLAVASADLHQASMGSYTLTHSTRTELNARIENLQRVNLDQVAQLETLAADLGAAAALIDQRLLEVRQLATAVHEDRLAVDARFATFSTQLDDFSSRYTQFSQAVSRFNADLVSFNTERVNLANQVSTLDTHLQTVVSVNNLRLRG